MARMTWKTKRFHFLCFSHQEHHSKPQKFNRRITDTRLFFSSTLLLKPKQIETDSVCTSCTITISKLLIMYSSLLLRYIVVLCYDFFSSVCYLDAINVWTGFVAINSKPSYKCHADVLMALNVLQFIRFVRIYFHSLCVFFLSHLARGCTKRSLCSVGVKLWCGFVKMHNWKVNM